MAYSAAIRIKTDYQVQGKPSRKRSNGTSALYLQVIIEGVAKKMPLEQSWDPDHFNEQMGKCLPYSGGQQSRCDDVNLICQQALSDANNVFTEFRLRRQPVTLEGFLREFRTVLSKDDLVQYWTQKMDERLKANEISQDSWKSQRTALRTLVKFSKKQPFASMLERGFAKKYDAYLRRAGYAATTRWGLHKDVKTYLRLAREEDNIWFPNPYANFANTKPQRGNWQALLKRDLQLLDAYYHTTEKGSTKRQVLRRWLFALASCGMRVSDQRRVQEDWRMFDVLSFIPYKNRKSGRKLMVKLSRRSQELWDDAVREQDSAAPYVFTRLSDQKANDHLHEIERELDLKLPLHNHIARHTFATQYLDEGGRVDVLQKMLNHSNIQSTMVYVRTTQAAHEEAAQKVDNMFGARPGPDQESPRHVTPRGWLE